MPATPELEPLAAFRPLPRIELIESRRIPSPYRALLDHEQDMTSTLEAFHQGRVGLHVLKSLRNESHYLREVALVLEGANAPVEYGAIRIVLDSFDAEGLRLILEGRRPLGAILTARGVGYVSRPSAFLQVQADERIKMALGLTQDCALFGRCNRLSDEKGRVLADIVEILPPIGR